MMQVVFCLLCFCTILWGVDCVVKTVTLILPDHSNKSDVLRFKSDMSVVVPYTNKKDTEAFKTLHVDHKDTKGSVYNATDIDVRCNFENSTFKLQFLFHRDTKAKTIALQTVNFEYTISAHLFPDAVEKEINQSRKTSFQITNVVFSQSKAGYTFSFVNMKQLDFTDGNKTTFTMKSTNATACDLKSGELCSIPPTTTRSPHTTPSPGKRAISDSVAYSMFGIGIAALFISLVVVAVLVVKMKRGGFERFENQE